MKTLMVILMVVSFASARGQSIVGTWQLTEEKNCVDQLMEESDTEKELTSAFGSSSQTVAKLIEFNAKGSGKEGVFSKGKKKGSAMSSFTYAVYNDELQIKDKKSGMITQRFVIEELSDGTLRMHRAERDCEVMIFSRIK